MSALSLERADACFLSPIPIARAVVLGKDESWAPALLRVGVDVGEISPDVAIAPSDRTRDAIATGAHTVIVEGDKAERELRRLGWKARTYLALPDLEAPQAFVPIGSQAGRYALTVWLTAWERWKVVRNAAVGELAARRLLPPVRRFVTVGSRDSVRPFLVTAATSLGVDPAAEWFLVTGHGDLLARGAFMLFPPDSAKPAWALKFCRVPGPDDRVDRDSRALRFAAEAGVATAARAPRFIGRLEAAGHEASLETAAPGRRANGVLSVVRPAHAKQRLIERVVEWLAQMARETSAAPKLLEPERRRLLEEVLPHWSALGASRDLVDELPPMQAVLQHNDLGTWNLMASGDAFTALDWESAKAHGFPLWDALYFLADALANLDGAEGEEGRREHFRKLFLGELPSSALLRSSLTQVAQASDVPLRAAGALTTLCWLHHALAHATRRAKSMLHQPDTHDPGWMFKHMATLWMGTEGLGPGWSPWPT